MSDSTRPTQWAHESASHGGAQRGAPGVADWTVVVLAVAIVIVSLVLSVRYLFWPGETDEQHIKRRVLQDIGGDDGR